MRVQTRYNWKLRNQLHKEHKARREKPRSPAPPVPPPNPVHVIHLKSYSGYRHIDKDPILHTVLELLRQSNRSNYSIAKEAGISPNTILRWQYGITRRPQVVTIRAVLRVLGYDLVLSRR